MIFQEKKVEDGYEYKIDDVFGTIEMWSSIKLDADILDDVVLLLLRQSTNAAIVNGTVKHDRGTVRYTFTKEPQWSKVTPEEESEWEDKDDYPLCENTPISIKETEKGFTLIIRYVDRIFKKLRRSAVVLRDVWKK